MEYIGKIWNENRFGFSLKIVEKKTTKKSEDKKCVFLLFKNVIYNILFFVEDKNVLLKRISKSEFR